MRVLTATEPDNVGGGLVFNGLFVKSNYDDRYNDFAGMGSSGGGIDVGPRGNGGNGGAGASSGGTIYGANMVDPIACKNDTYNAGLVGMGIGGAVGGYLGKGSVAGFVGGVVLGGASGFLLGAQIGSSNSPNCKPK